MEIEPFKEEYRQAFIDFNTDWIVNYFGALEGPDLEQFENIDSILEEGGMIFFAVENDVAVATCMTMALDKHTWEICKLGSNSAVPHKGAGAKVVKACMNWAVEHGAKKIVLVSNRRMEAALHIYSKYGFREIPLDDSEYERGDIAMEYVCSDADE